MTVESWTTDGDGWRARVLRTARAVARRMVWPGILVGPLLLGGIAGWLSTNDNVWSGLLGAAQSGPRDVISAFGLETAELNADRFNTFPDR